MNRKVRRIVNELCQLIAVVIAVIVLTLGFYTLSRILSPTSKEMEEDVRQIDEMRNYHHTQGKTDLLFF